jgi:hypothetical protein
MHQLVPNAPQLSQTCGSVRMDGVLRGLCTWRLTGTEGLSLQQIQDACRVAAASMHASTESTLLKRSVPAVGWGDWSGINEACDSFIHEAQQRASPPPQSSAAAGR